MSWTEVGTEVRKAELLPPKFQALVAAARKRGDRWRAAHLVEANKYGGRKRIGFIIWIPSPEILGTAQTGLFAGETSVKTAYRFSRSHPLARSLKEAHHADAFTGWKRKGFRSHGLPTFAHWLEYRAIRERAGKGYHGFKFWQTGMWRRWRDPMARRGWPKYPGAVYKEPHSNPRRSRRVRKNAGWPKHPFLAYGTLVRATQPIRWRDVRIPKGALGKVLRMLDGGEGVHVAFDKYGTMQCLAYEVRPVSGPQTGRAAKNPRVTIQFYRDRNGVIRRWGTGVKSSLPDRRVLLVDYKHGGIFDTWKSGDERNFDLVKRLN